LEFRGHLVEESESVTCAALPGGEAGSAHRVPAPRVEREGLRTRWAPRPADDCDRHGHRVR